VNLSESEVMAGLLSKAGHTLVKGPANADLMLLNVCTVKGEAKAIREIMSLRRRFPVLPLLVAGCITPELVRACPGESFLSTHSISFVVRAVEGALQGRRMDIREVGSLVKINLPRQRKNCVVGVVPISSGCNNSCTYCSVRAVKGSLFSYRMDDVLREIKNALSSGCSEIWLTSQDTAAYGTDRQKKSLLPELISEAAALRGSFMIRVGMMGPKTAYPVLDELVSAFSCRKVFKFIHLPVQSGSPRVLGLMGRGYSPGMFTDIVDAFRRALPRITLSTDIICGFPTETDAEFMESMELVKRVQPGVLNISRFQARPGTAAERMLQIHGRVSKERSRKLTALFRRLAMVWNMQWVGWRGSILIDEKGKDNTLVGRNDFYRPVIVKGNAQPGQRVRVKITGATSHDLRGEIIRN